METRKDGFTDLIAEIERDFDVVIVLDADRLTRNLTDRSQFEKACIRRGVLLSAYTGYLG